MHQPSHGELRLHNHSQTPLYLFKMYSYNPLKASTSFQLVYILPGASDDTLRLNITEENLENARDYHALSYEWQGKTGTCPVAVADDEFLVTPNLFCCFANA